MAQGLSTWEFAQVEVSCPWTRDFHLEEMCPIFPLVFLCFFVGGCFVHDQAFSNFSDVWKRKVFFHWLFQTVSELKNRKIAEHDHMPSR